MPESLTVSAASHLEIDVERWRHRVAKEHRERAPRRVSLPTGGDAWLIEGQPLRPCGLELGVRPGSNVDVTGVTYEGSPGTGGPEQRLAEQDEDGVDAEVLFPGGGGPDFWRSIGNDDSYRAVVRGYNEYLAEEYCSADRNRLVGVGVIPETGLRDALAELAWCNEAGLKAVSLNAFPSGKSFATRADDEFWRAALDAGVALTALVGFNMKGKKATFDYPRRPTAELSPGARDPIRRIGGWAMFGGFNVVQMVMDGLFERIPELRFYFAGSHIGWIPHFLEQFDSLYDRNIYWATDAYGLVPLADRPSEYVRRHILWGFVNEPFGVRWRHEIGVDRIMWGNDFPHSGTDWPHSAKVIEANFVDVPAAERAAMVGGNAAAYFGLRGPGEPGVLPRPPSARSASPSSLA